MGANQTPIARSSLGPDKVSPLDDVRDRIAKIWLIGAGLIFIILVLQSLLHVYKDATQDLTQDVWGWFLPTLLPSLALIVTVLTYTALDPLTTGSVVRKSFLQIATWLSIIYLLMVLLTIAIQPFSSKGPAESVALMRTSNLWLGPFQGLVASALGALFVSKEKRDGV
jgi:predicted permease